MKTDELIVELTRSLEPVERLRSPAVRLARWTMVSLSMAALGVLAIGPRADISTAIRQPSFAALALMALVTSIAAAASALVLSIPGEERTPAQRSVPLLVGAAWVLTLVAMLNAGGAAWTRLLALPVHAACLVEIAGFAVVPAMGALCHDPARRAVVAYLECRARRARGDFDRCGRHADRLSRGRLGAPPGRSPCAHGAAHPRYCCRPAPIAVMVESCIGC